MRKHWYLQRCRLFVQHAAFGDHVKNTGIYTVFASLRNVLHKDVEQVKLSQASMPFGDHAQNCRNSGSYSALFIYRLRVADLTFKG